MDDFEEEISVFKESLKNAGEEITSDVNSKSPKWGETMYDGRGQIMCKMVDRTDLAVVNTGHDFTFRREDTGLIIDITIATRSVAKIIKKYKVLEEETNNK